ncbi:MAG: hypothetical protein JXA62_09335 [Candidatus Aminicenantes bacterium]|nr:hypothetical protein [Candidatus Aminicenantes bacterium]
MLTIGEGWRQSEVMYCDESFFSPAWHSPKFEGAVSSRQSPDWFIDFSRWIHANLMKGSPEIKVNLDGSCKPIETVEYKADLYISAIKHYPKKQQLLNGVYNSVIIMIDPLGSIRETQNFRFVHSVHSKGKELELVDKAGRTVLDSSHPYYRDFKLEVLKYSQFYIKSLHPYTRIGNFLAFLPDHYLLALGKTPQIQLPEGLDVLQKNTEKALQNSSLSALMAFAAFYDFFDLERNILNQYNFDNPGALYQTVFLRLGLLQGVLRKKVVYDNGHSDITKSIRNFKDQLILCLPFSGLQRIPNSITEKDSRGDRNLNAADFVAGVARDIYRRFGVSGLKVFRNFTLL